MTVAIFTSRTCPACGWHETKRYAGSSCFVCRGPMDPKLSELLELWRKRAAHGAQLAAAMPPGEIPAKDAPRLAAYMAAADNWTKAADELERVIREAAAGELSRIARAGLTEAQDDGRACVRCGLEGLPMLPTGKRGSHGAQLFECERHGRRGATCADPDLVACCRCRRQMLRTRARWDVSGWLCVVCSEGASDGN